MPVHGGVALLIESLAALRASVCSPFEVLVVDDGTPAQHAAAIEAAAVAGGGRLVRQAQAGPGAARNRGAQEAEGEILVFIDADVKVHPETLGQIRAAFEPDAGLAGVFGSYDNKPSAGTLVSDYRNLLHHYVHQNSRREAKTFWAGCGAIRREVFLKAGGFDAAFGRPSIEDVDLGLRLTGAGHRIELRKEIQCTHAKCWTLRSFFLTDLFQRAIPWTEMLLTREGGLPADLNFGVSQKLSVPLALVLVLSLLFGLWVPMLVCGILLVGLNLGFFGYLARLRGVMFAVATFPLQVVHYLASALGLFGGVLRVWKKWDPQIGVAALVLAVVVAGAQVWSGTYQADFSGFPDEPSHYVTGVMAAEYLKAPTLRPMHYAEQYYLHYPKVGIGHWPPLFYLVEGLWFVLFGVSKTAALLLQLLLGYVLALGVYVLARRYASWVGALGAAMLLILTLPYRQSLSWVMAEHMTAVLVVGAAVAFARYLEGPGLVAGQLFGVLAAFALLTKGSASPLVLLPLFSVLIARRFDVLRRLDFWLSALPVILLALPWYVFSTRFVSPNSGSIGRSVGSGAWMPGLEYGPVVLVSALIGFVLLSKRDPYVATLAGLVGTYAVAPFWIGAFREGRHLLPAIAGAAVLASGVWGRLKRPELAVGCCLALSWWLTPGTVGFAPERFRSWAQGIPDLGAILVSGSGTEEGAVVAAIAEREPKPKRVVFRAGRVLATSGWNGERYRLLVKDEAEARARMDELGVAVFVQPEGAHAPHDLLIEGVTNGWRREVMPGFVVRVNPVPVVGKKMEIEQQRLGRKLLLDR
jgi:GT2 family glycosyltransferase